MARVEDWFNGWLTRHFNRHPREDWPSAMDGQEFYLGWRKLFVQNGISEDIADEASQLMMAEPPRFRAEHPSAILEVCRGVWRKRSAERTQGVGDKPIDVARWLSRDCKDCGGGGFAVRYRLRSHGHPLGNTIALYCRCAIGRYLEQNHRSMHPETRKRMYDLYEHPWLWDAFREPPTQEQLAAVATERDDRQEEFF